MRLTLTTLFFLGLTILSAQHYSYPITEGGFSGELPTITGEFFSYYLIPADGQGDWLEAAQIHFTSIRENSEWTSFSREEHNPDRILSKLYYADPTWTNFTIQIPDQATGILHIYDPGQSANAQTTGRQLISNTCPCTQPTVLQRQDWCPAGNCPVDATPASTVVTHLVVHHSATSNTSNDWAGVVRTIWDFHVNGNGWDDIGYNFLVDPLGNIYEGRGNNIRGAHFCGNNTGTLGHCLLGNFTDQPPESAALASLSQLLAWRACLGDIDPLGTSLHAASQANLFNITAHREGCSTACPGDSFFPNFPMFRQQVADTIANCITSVQEEPLWAATLQVTPNPTITREVQLLGLANEAITLRIFNDLGQIIDIQRLGEVDFKVAVLPETAGLYYLSIELAGEQVVRKIIKE